jgi:formylmethanofuran dehydrogenase subunit D
MPRTFILIPGRSARQGVALNEGKYTEGYLDETSTLRMHPDDMLAVGIEAGEEVRMWNDVGSVTVSVISARDECPQGLIFICYGDKSSQLMAGETHGSGMPDSKGLDVHIESATSPVHDQAVTAIGVAGTETAADDRPAFDLSGKDSDPAAARGLPSLDKTNASGRAASSTPQSVPESSKLASSSSSVSSNPPKRLTTGQQMTRPATGSTDRDQDPVSTGQIIVVVLSLIAVLILLLTSGQ